MDNSIKIIVKGFISLALIVSFSVSADTKTIDEAVKRYYAGFPDEAISMMKPLALSGDVNAQYLLGNILYGLSKTKNFNELDGPIKWYRMAAEQDSAAANYALGVIFYNKWSESRAKKDVAASIIYYQKASDLGYKKAHVPLNRIKARSGITHQEAATLVKAQGITPVPKSESGVQAPKTEAANLVSNDTQKPIDKSSAKLKMDKTNESVAESKTTSEDSNQITQTTDRSDDGITTTITLADIASQCQNYTEAGFDVYSETIKGALLSGKATIKKFGRDSSKTGNYSVSLTNNRFGIVVLLDLHDVPKEVAARFEEGDKTGVRGLIVDSKSVGSNCAVSLIYEPVKG